MKQAAFVYALGSLAPRLMSVRKRTWVYIGLGVVAFFALAAWAAIAVLSWAWGQVPAMTESGKQAAAEAMKQVEQAAPGLKAQLDPLMNGRVIDQVKKTATGEWPSRDVSGIELPGITRYPGFLRTHYQREGRTVELRYMGKADFQPVLNHYVSQLKTAGYSQEVLSASQEVERHRFTKSSDALDFEIRRTAKDGKIEVIFLDTIQ